MLFKLARALGTAHTEKDCPQAEPIGLPAEYLETLEKELVEFIATGDLDAAVSYFRLKLTEAHLLSIKEGLTRQRRDGR